MRAYITGAKVHDEKFPSRTFPSFNSSIELYLHNSRSFSRLLFLLLEGGRVIVQNMK